MISRNLTRRLEELEARIAPVAEPPIVEIVYVSPDGDEKLQYRVEMPTSTGPAWRQRMRGGVGRWPACAHSRLPILVHISPDPARASLRPIHEQGVIRPRDAGHQTPEDESCREYGPDDRLASVSISCYDAIVPDGSRL